MYRNYLRTAFRNILKYKLYSLINVLGLSVGIACCVIISLYAFSEFTYDEYHPDSDRIYRVLEHREVPVGVFDLPYVCPAVAPAIKSGFAQVESIARIDPMDDGIVVVDDVQFFDDRMFLAEQDIFNILHIPFVGGHKETALTRPFTVVMTQSSARRYFGDQNPVGKTLDIRNTILGQAAESTGESQPYTVTAVVEDPPSNTHFKYNVFVSLKNLDGHPKYELWDAHSAYTYLKLHEGVDADEFESQISQLAYDHYGESLRSWNQKVSFLLQNVTDIHFNTKYAGNGMFGMNLEMEQPGRRTDVIIYAIIGLLVLLIACMNYVNLSNTRSVYRAREVALRKVVGASRFQLVLQFLGESVLVTLFAFVLSFGVVELLLPVFNEMANTQLRVGQLADAKVLISVAGLILFVSVLSGIYPAFVLTSSGPASIVREYSSTGKKGSGLIKALIVGQFAISIFLMIGTSTVYEQLEFMKGSRLGFDIRQKLVIPLKRSAEIKSRIETFKDDISNIGGVNKLSISSSVPGHNLMTRHVRFPEETSNESRTIQYLTCDYEYLSLFNIDILAGRAFSKGFYDKKNAYMINEEALKCFGWNSPAEAIGKLLRGGSSGATKEIVGVTANSHFEGMQDEIAPMLYDYSNEPYWHNYLTISISSDNIVATVDEVKTKWREFYPTLPFGGYFLEDRYSQLYHTEQQIGMMLGIIALIGMILSCLGLLGIVAFTVEARKSEIAIRKVLGASVGSLVRLLTGRFVGLVILANLLAIPAGYFVMNTWLECFAYRISLRWTDFAWIVLGSLLVSCVAASIQSTRTALSNPIEALKCE